MRAFGAVAGLEGGRAEGGLDVALGGPGLANPEGPGRLSEGGKLGSLGDGGVAPMVRLTEVRYEGGGREATIGSTAISRSESEEEMSCRRCCWDDDAW